MFHTSFWKLGASVFTTLQSGINVAPGALCKNNNKNLGFSFMYLVSVDPMEETLSSKLPKRDMKHFSISNIDRFKKKI